MHTSVTCSDLHFSWPSGDAVFNSLDFAAGAGRTGLIGTNGSGKSTLLKLIAGELAPASGTVRVRGELGYLPQDLALDTEYRVDQILRIRQVRAALHAIERGEANVHNLAVVGENWDAEERALATLDRLGLGHVELDSWIGALSGGELVLLGLAAELLREPAVLLLDEPTNNLDIDARRRLHDAVATWRGAVIVVSHDRGLLELMDDIAELRDGAVRSYGGNLTAYEQAVAVEQEAAERTVRAAESDLKRQRRELIDAQTKLDRRKRYGQKLNDNKREPKVVMGERKRQAQVSAGKHRTMHQEKVRQARTRLDGAEAAVRADDEIRIDLPGTEVPAGRGVLELCHVLLCHGGQVNLAVRGAERIVLTGRNGAGKTTLLRTITGALAPDSGTVRLKVPHRHLPQRLDILDDALTVAENVGQFAPDASTNAVRAGLARFLFTGESVHRPVATLSGGERFRATLAALLLAEPAPQLLLLDEPTNNLDMASARQLTTALESYRGALIVASHDQPFLRSIGPTRWLRLDGGLTDTGA